MENQACLAHLVSVVKLGNEGRERTGHCGGEGNGRRTRPVWLTW